MKNFILTICLLALAGCQTLDSSYFRRRPRCSTQSPVIVRNGGRDNSFEDGSLYVCAVETPPGYDWQRDSAAGSIEGSLLVFKNGQEVLKIPCGHSALVSSDPDTHHLLGGDLYTEYSTSTQTIIKKNGEELYRYQGREYLRGLLLCGGNLWALSSGRGGDGFSLRKNGEVVLRRESGKVIGNDNLQPDALLYLDGGDEPCFAFVSENSYYIARGAQTEELTLPANGRVLDIRIASDEPAFLFQSFSGTSLMAYWGSKSRIHLVEDHIFQAALICGDDNFSFVGLLKNGKDIFWSNNSTKVLESSDELLFYRCGNSLAYVLEKSGMISVYYGGKSFEVDSEMRFMCKDCLCFSSKGSCYLALTPSDITKKPVVFGPGGTKEYDVNGYLSAVEFVED